MKLAAQVALLASALSSCGWRTEGVSMALSAAIALEAPAQADASGIHFTLQDGTLVSIAQGWVTVSAIEIFQCPQSGLWKLWNELRPYGVAYAHSMSAPTRIGVPTVVSALSVGGAATALGTLRPPAAEFCTVRVTFAPADDDAVGLPAEVEMVGQTLWVDGTLTAPGGSPQPFHLESGGTQQLDLDVGPWTLSADEPELSQVVELAPARWLDGVDFGGSQPALAALTAVVASTLVR